MQFNIIQILKYRKKLEDKKKVKKKNLLDVVIMLLIIVEWVCDKEGLGH